eukprot:scaffold900_cov399-Pavlova_lutheri.AAC.15
MSWVSRHRFSDRNWAMCKKEVPSGKIVPDIGPWHPPCLMCKTHADLYNVSVHMEDYRMKRGNVPT